MQPVGADAPPSGQLVARLQGSAGMVPLPGPLTDLAVYDSGDVVSSGPEGYHRGTMSADALAAIRACADGVGFASLEPKYLRESGSSSSGTFCSISDATTTDVLAPTSSGTKTVSAYALSLRSSSGCLTFPSALTDTYALLRQVGEQAQQAGTPWTPTTVVVKRARSTSTRGGPVAAWPPIPVPATGAAVRIEGPDAQALLHAVQPPASSVTLPRYFQRGGEQAMTLPDGTVAAITYMVVLPGDDPIPLQVR